MKKIILLFLLYGFSNCLNAQENPIDMSKLKTYFFVMLKKGPERNQDSATVNTIQKGHFANMQRLAKEKKLIIAGPFLDDSDWKGIFIFDGKTKEEVEEWVKTDPAVKAGRLSYEIHPWMTEKGSCFN